MECIDLIELILFSHYQLHKLIVHSNEYLFNNT